MDSEAAHNRGGGSMSTTVKHVEAADEDGEGRGHVEQKKEEVEQGVGVRGRMCEGVEEWRTERNKQQSRV